MIFWAIKKGFNMTQIKSVTALLSEARDSLVDQAARANRLKSPQEKAELERRRK